ALTAVAAVSMLLGFLVSGGINLQLAANVPASTVSVVESLMIVFIAGAAIWTTRRPKVETSDTQDVSMPELTGATR
ncbi:ABC transporter permease, partial [Nocardia tengchongensis]